jgi:catechol 2,3-dioxygenase-like lactoylglutathione lyase family enzyme
MPTDPPKPSANSFASWKIDHAGIRVGDIEAAVAWYVEVLSCRVVRRWSLGSKQFCWLSLPGAAGIIIELLANSAPDTEPLITDFQLLSRSHLGFLVDSVDDAVAELKRREVVVTSEPRDVVEAGRRVAFFVDPWGNLFETIEPLVD